MYIPNKKNCVDGCLIHFTSILGSKQYIHSKRARYGVKLYKLCERATGYTCITSVFMKERAASWNPLNAQSI